MLPDKQFFFFDFTLERPNIKNASFAPADNGGENTITEPINRCPYKIPKVDEISKLINKASYRISPAKFLTDTFECGAIAISNQFDYRQSEQREERYKQIMNTYQPQEREIMAETFGKIYALLTSVVYDDGEFNDWLGELYMRSDMGNKQSGQFFTPYHISKFMAKVTLNESIIKDKQDKDEILTINEPCCGSGGMVIAAMDVLQNDYHFNYAHNCFVVCEDIDIRCVHMAYLQLSLAGVPAIIRHQNTLTRETWSVWETPAFIMQYMHFRQFENYA